MPQAKFRDPDTGRTVKLRWDEGGMPTEAELEEVFASLPPAAGADTAAAQAPPAQISDDEFKRLMSTVDDGGPEAQDYIMRFLSGFSDMGSGLVQLGAQAAEKMGFEGAGRFRNDFENFRNAFERTTAIDAPGAAGATAEVAGKIAPALAVPGGVAGSIPLRMATGAAAGAGIGASEFVGEGESRAANTLKGAAFGAAGPAVIAGAPAAVSGIVKSGVRGRATQDDVAKAVADFATSGATPTVGEATGSPIYQGFETLMSKYLGGAPLRRALQDTSEKVQTRLTAIADDLSPVKGAESAGRTIQRGISGEGGFVDRFLERSGNLWKSVDERIGDDVITASNTRATLDNLVSEGPLASVLNTPQVARIRDAMQETGEAIPYSELKQLRSVVGRKLGSNDLVSDVPRAELKQLYGAISRDIEDAARAKGGDIIKFYERANNFTRSGHKRIEDFLERTTNKTDLDKIFNAVTKGGEGSAVVNAFKRSLEPEEWEAVVSNVVRRMGKATSGQQDDLGEAFSLNTFLTQWDKLGPAKKALFAGSPKINQYSKDLDAIAATASRVREGMRQMANPSETARSTANIGATVLGGAALGTGNLAVAGSVLGTVALNNTLSRLMTNPQFVRWLATTSKAKPGQLPAQISKLATIATEVPPDDAAAIDELLSDLAGAMQPEETPQRPL